MVDEEPRKIGLTWPLIIVLAVALPVVVVALMLGNTPDERGDRLFHLAKTLVYGVVIVMVEVGAAFPIRQWRRKDLTGETTIREIRDGTKTVEKWYGMPPGRMALPAPQYAQDPLGLPSVQRTMYAAMMGQGADGRRGYVERAQPPEVLTADYEDDDAEREALPWSDNLPAAATDGQNDVPPPVGWSGEMRL